MLSQESHPHKWTLQWPLVTSYWQITGASFVYSTLCSGADQRKYQSSASLAFMGGIKRLPVNSPHKGQVTRKMFPFDGVIMNKNTKRKVDDLFIYFDRSCQVSRNYRQRPITWKMSSEKKQKQI